MHVDLHLSKVITKLLIRYNSETLGRQGTHQYNADRTESETYLVVRVVSSNCQLLRHAGRYVEQRRRKETFDARSIDVCAWRLNNTHTDVWKYPEDETNTEPTPLQKYRLCNSNTDAFDGGETRDSIHL